MSYGSTSDCQILAFGAANSSLDTKTQKALDVASSFINSELNLEKDSASPSTAMTECADLLAAAILRTKGDAQEDPYWKMGTEMLKKLRGDSPDDAPWRLNVPVERFRGLVSQEDRRPHSFVN